MSPFDIMLFKFASLLAAAALVSANTVTFKALDDVNRVIYFYENPGSSFVTAQNVSGHSSVQVEFPQKWNGNFYAVAEGAKNETGMLGEVSFQSWGDITFFDVSAIVNANDLNGVKQLMPLNGTTPISGCEIFPCANAYYLPDDVQTKGTDASDLLCTLGGNGTTITTTSRRSDPDADSPKFTRDFVLGKWMA